MSKRAHIRDAKPRRRTKMKKGQKMPFREAMELADDDLPDGAYWAMCHEIAGLEYGDGFDELIEDES